MRLRHRGRTGPTPLREVGTEPRGIAGRELRGEALRVELQAANEMEGQDFKGSPSSFVVRNHAKEGVAIGRVKQSLKDRLVWTEISIAQGVDASLIAVAATAVPLIKDAFAPSMQYANL